MAASCDVVTCDEIAAIRRFEVVATRCDAAQHGLLQPFSAVGEIDTAKLGITNALSSVSGTRIVFG